MKITIGCKFSQKGCLISCFTILLISLLAGIAGAATQINSCTVISSPGEYVFSQNIMDSTEKYCINITSNDVVLDGANHTIDGMKIPDTYGINIYDPTTTLTNITLKNLVVKDWANGLYLKNVRNGRIYNNEVRSNNRGIYLVASDNNTIHNNYFSNINNARDDENNIWNITKTMGNNILLGAWLGGNYWSDYSGIDTDGDGLGNTLLPYNSSGAIVNGGDNFPLTIPDEIPPILTAIEIIPSSASVVKGNTQQFIAKPIDQFGIEMTVGVIWSSSDLTVGNIDSNGVFTANDAGTVTITATSGSVSGTATVTVPEKPMLTAITVSPPDASLSLGDTQTFSAMPEDQFGDPFDAIVTWSISDTKVGTINAKTGVFAAKAEGTATVTATNGSISETTSITVTSIYNFDDLATTDETSVPNLGFLTTLGIPSINDNGTVALTGVTASGGGIFVTDESGTLLNINPSWRNRYFGDLVQINNAGKVVAVDRLSGSPPATYVRIWDPDVSNNNTIIARGGTITTPDFDAVGTAIMNNNGQVSFWGLNGVQIILATGVTPNFNTVSIGSGIRPMIADTGQIVVRTGNQPTDPIRLYNYDFTDANNIASTDKWAAMGRTPGISDDGKIVTFYGDLNENGATALNTNPGPGIFASIDEDGDRKIIRIAGIRIENNSAPGGDDDGICDEGEACIAAELGFDSDGNPNNFSSFDVDSRVGVVHQDLGESGLKDDSFTVAFIATPNQGIFDVQKGLWTVRVDVEEGTQERVYNVTKPMKVVQVGDKKGEHTITDIQVNDPISNVVDSEIRGEHNIAFLVSTHSVQSKSVKKGTNSKPDLRITSEDITITETNNRNVYDISVKIHNDGTAKLGEGKTKVIILKKIGTKISNDITIEPKFELPIPEIPRKKRGQDSFKIVHQNIELDLNNPNEYIEVEVNPRQVVFGVPGLLNPGKRKIKELNENNNEAVTHTIQGKISTKGTSSDGTVKNLPLKGIKFEFQEKVGADWESKYTYFTDKEGRYVIPLNWNGITNKTEGRINTSLEFSPDRDKKKIKAKFIDNAIWGTDIYPDPDRDAIPISEAAPIGSVNMKEDFGKDIYFKPEKGGSIYQAFVNAYIYFKKPPVHFEPTGRIDVDIGHADIAKCDEKPTSCTDSLNYIYIYALKTQKEFGYGRQTVSHEYSHIVSNMWGLPYGPNKRGNVERQDGLDENWANFGAYLARRNDPDLIDTDPLFYIGNEVTSHGFRNEQICIDKSPLELYCSVGDVWSFSMADVWTELDSTSIETPNKVVEVLSKDKNKGIISYDIKTVKQFYEAYILPYMFIENNLVNTLPIWTNQQKKGYRKIFEKHGYNIAGWPPLGDQDPDIFTNHFHDYKVDTNGDKIAEYLNIDVGLNITTSGNYSVHGFLKESSKDGYCLGSNKTFLNTGIQTIPLSFDGKCIFQNRLNGSYSLTRIYMEDRNLTEIDFRLDIYNTSVYNFMEFSRPIVAFTSTYSDYGIDLNNDGLYDYLKLNVPVDVSTPGKYIISGSLFDFKGNYIGFYSELLNLSKGLQNVEVRFDGVSIYANRANGSLIVKGLTISDLDENLIYYDPIPFITNAYNYTQFQISGGTFINAPTEQVLDVDNDTLFDYLIINAELNITLNGTYRIVGRLDDATGYGITIANNYSDLSKGRQNLYLFYEGEILRRNKANGPYNITLTLYSNDSFIDKRTYTTQAYSYKQFQAAPDDYFNASFNDRGIDLNGKELYDYLTIDANISTDVKSGNYNFEGYLYNENYSFVAYTNITSYIDENTRTVQFNFSGQRIWSTHLLNSTYRLNLKIYDENDSRIASLEDAYLTSRYNYNEFEFPLIPIVTDLKNTTYSYDHINWTWSDPTIANFSSVKIYIDGVFKASVPKGVEFYNAIGLTPDAEHTISTKTVEISGKTNRTWVNHTARTAPLGDIVPPVIKNRNPEQGSTFPKGTTSVSLSLETNEVAECRLSETTREFSSMQPFDGTILGYHMTQVDNLTNGKNYTFFINCRDISNNENNTESFTFYIHNRTFLPPVAEQIPDITAFENQTVTIPLNVTDPENDPLVISVQDRSMFGYVPIASRIIVEDRTLKLLTNFNDAGRYYLRVAVSDGKDTVTSDFTLNVINVNRPPILAPIGNKIATEGSFFSYKVIASDPDGDELSFSDNTTLFNINPFSGMISFTPGISQAGDNHVNISVTDGEYTDSEDVLFSISNVNNPPVIQAILPQKAIVDELFTLQINASDPDNNDISFSDDTPLFDISAGGLINFTPVREDEGIYLINITATDGLLNSTRILNLVITGNNRPPIITSITDWITVYRNQSFDINVTACDPDTDAGCN